MTEQTPPASPEPGHYLLYDGFCALCTSAVARLKAWGLLDTIITLPLQDASWLSPSLIEQGRAQILLIERDSNAKETLWGGLDAIIELMGRKPEYSLFGVCLRWPPCLVLMRALYRIVAYNRRLLSPVPPRNLSCACDPPENWPLRQQFYGLLVTIILVNLMIFATGASHSTSGIASRLSIGGFFYPLVIACVVGKLVADQLLKQCAPQPIPNAKSQTLISLTNGSLYCLLAGLLLPTISAPSAPHPLPHPAFILNSIGLGVQTLGTAAQLFPRFRILAAPAWSPWLWLATDLTVALTVLKYLT